MIQFDRNFILPIILMAILTGCGGGEGSANIPPPGETNLDWDEGNWDEETWQ